MTQTSSEVENKTISINLLDPHKRNYRKHPDSQLHNLTESLKAFGQTRSIVVRAKGDGRYTILAGHGITEAARRLKFKAMRCDIVPDSWTDQQALAYIAADNQAGFEDDLVMLAELLEEIKNDSDIPLEALGHSEESLAALLDSLADAELNGDNASGTEDEVPEVDEVNVTARLGDVWQLGRHRIACIDSTNRVAVEKLLNGKKPDMVWADPPYGVKVVKDSMVGSPEFGIAKKGVYAPVIGDETTDTAEKSILAVNKLCVEAKQVWWGANYYADLLDPSSCWLIWDKRSDSGIENTFADCELAWTNMSGQSRIYRQLWVGMIREGEHEKRVHPTQKPIALAEWAYEKYGKEDDLIFDPFLGSGMSVIAAERTNRTVYGCELSPAYIDVICKRFKNETGIEPKLIDRIDA